MGSGDQTRVLKCAQQVLYRGTSPQSPKEAFFKCFCHSQYLGSDENECQGHTAGQEGEYPSKEETSFLRVGMTRNQILDSSVQNTHPLLAAMALSGLDGHPGQS